MDSVQRAGANGYPRGPTTVSPTKLAAGGDCRKTPTGHAPWPVPCMRPVPCMNINLWGLSGGTVEGSIPLSSWTWSGQIVSRSHMLEISDFHQALCLEKTSAEMWTDPQDSRTLLSSSYLKVRAAACCLSACTDPTSVASVGCPIQATR